MCNCSNISNCNCNDCSTIVVPSIPGPTGPTGPQGPAGADGADGLDAGNVIDTITSFSIGPVEGTRRTYTPGVLVSNTSEITKNEDRLKIRAMFKLAEVAQVGSGELGVYINTTVAMTNSSPVAVYDGNLRSDAYLYIELFFDRQSDTTFNVTGYSCFSSDTAEFGTSYYNVPSEGNVFLLKNINKAALAPVNFDNSDFYVFLGSENLGEITAEYLTVEYILRKS